MLIEVTDYELRHGESDAPRRCPLALAIGPRLPVGIVSVDEDGVVRLYEMEEHLVAYRLGLKLTMRRMTRYFKPGRLLREFPLPEAAVAWMRHHDLTGEGSPFSFELPG